MNYLKKIIPLGIIAIYSTLFLASCDKGEETTLGESSSVKFHLTDAPASYDAVYIEVLEVQVHVEEAGDTTGNEGNWIVMDEVSPGIYDLLQFRNGMDTLIAEGEIPAGRISQIRLILGDENTVVVNGVTHSIKTPSAQQSGLKLKVNYDLEPGLAYEFWIDFDASRSIVAKGNGGYNLKPVINVFTKNATGSIEGYVDPVDAEPMVLAYEGNDSSMALADETTGYFLISGLDAGSYTVEFTPDTIYSVQQVNGVNVVTGQVTTLDTIHF